MRTIAISGSPIFPGILLMVTGQGAGRITPLRVFDEALWGF
jgi:hypothetical protein